MARPDKHYAQKKETLAQIAFDIFLVNGYEQTTISQIMKTAGLTRAGMYHYFSSKADILDAAIELGISKEIIKTREEMDGKSVMERLVIFTQGVSIHNDMIVKLRSYRRNHKDSYASYRIREYGIHAYIPILEEILNDGIKENLFTIDYPKQAAEFMVLLVRAISEDNILPNCVEEEGCLRIKALLQLMHSWLGMSDSLLIKFEALFKEDHERLEKERKH